MDLNRSIYPVAYSKHLLQDKFVQKKKRSSLNATSPILCIGSLYILLCNGVCRHSPRC